MIRLATLEELSTMGKRMLTEDTMVLAKAEENLIRTATFLSHSSADDKTYIAGAISVLKRHGASVYIDKKDKALPPVTSRVTADVLRARIRQTARFVLFATEKSKDSRWMPWELGIADGHKSPGCVAVFPAAQNAFNDEWADQEYLGIYDRIEYGDIRGIEGQVWMVRNTHINTATTLRSWLAG